jgi:hypothetical protein
MLTVSFSIEDTPFQHVTIEGSHAFFGICMGYHLLIWGLNVCGLAPSAFITLRISKHCVV